MPLAALDSALSIGDMDIPGYRLGQLKGKRKGIWSIFVRGDWRVYPCYLYGALWLELSLTCGAFRCCGIHESGAKEAEQRKSRNGAKVFQSSGA